MKRICVFCGSRAGARPAYRATAEALGRALAAAGIELVYGGGNVGLMGVVANACLGAGGRVIGVIPQALLEWEVEHPALTRLEVVESMHARKARMAELSEGFIALPGGIGTFEELFEILTWGQLGFHQHPVALLDVEGYYAPLMQMFEQSVSEGFVRPEQRGLLLYRRELAGLLEAMAAYRAPAVDRRVEREQL